MAHNVVIGSSKPGDHGPLQAALQRKGIEASVFSDGAALIEAARNRVFDLVVVDLHLGGLHGIEVARSLGGQRASILVDEDEAAISDLRRLGLEVLVRPQGGAEGLAEGIDHRLRGSARLFEDVRQFAESNDREQSGDRLRDRLLDLVDGDEERLIRTVLEDPVTHLLSGVYLKNWRVEEEWFRSRNQNAPLALVRIGIDGGAQDLVQRHGAGALREVEQRLAGLLLTELDGTDLPAREAAGRFLVLMPETSAEAAARRTFAVRREFAELEFNSVRGGPFRVTLCIGLAAVPHPHVGSVSELLDRAEEALTAAERLGKSRVCLWQGVRELREEDVAGAH